MDQFFRRASYRVPGKKSVEANKRRRAPHHQSEEVCIGDLARSGNQSRIENRRIRQRKIVIPKFMKLRKSPLKRAKNVNHFCRCATATWVRRLR